MINVKIVSSLEKCFPDNRIADFPSLSQISVLKNERLSLQLLAESDGDDATGVVWAIPSVDGELARFSDVRRVECLPSMMPVYPGNFDDNYLRTAPGLYPDLLTPVDGAVPIVPRQARACWFEFGLDGSVTGEFPVTIGLLSGDGTLLASASVTVTVIDAALPEHKLSVTQWFHGDCIANYYGCEVFSRKWWKIVENFVRVAVRNGQNTLLTPIFTPPLDTAKGTERRTVQLVGVTLENGNYSFDYSKLDRWIKMCDRCGIVNFEISHLFTQWGAAHAPKIIATVNGETRRIFGWDTEAAGEEYSRFLHAFLPDFIAHMKARGDDRRCLFHVSDEPSASKLEQYKRSKAVVADLLEGYTVMDALASYDFYRLGIVSTPICSSSNLKPFIDHEVENLWVYYCCGHTIGVSNRFFAMPQWRTRCIGAQMFKYKIAGFLQWGYNFYNNCGSTKQLNPYLDTCGDYFGPSGDAFSVYPGPDGCALESIRLAAFHEGLQDLRAFELCAELCGREETVAAIEEICGNVTFDECPKDAATVLAVREKINALIADKARLNRG